jgi:SAM-dependent methyltransferase
MNYTNGESASLLTNRNDLSQRRRIKDSSQSSRHSALIKGIACDAINCALAHWYFLPGLELQRYRLRLAFSLIRTPEAARHQFSTLPATLYLDSDFALKCLRAQSRVGSYLDVSSPWVFPLYVLTAFKPDRALLLNANGRTRNFLEHLKNHAELDGTDVQTKDLGHLSGLSESFDTITCLARLSADEQERELLKKMWQALNPGGVLILSVACAGAESRVEGDIEEPADRESLQSPAVPYNSQLLKSRVLDVLGEPRSYAIYGEDAYARRTSLASARSASPRSASWGESVAVGNHWRRCSSISQIRGQGIIALKFTKPSSLSEARAVS